MGKENLSGQEFVKWFVGYLLNSCQYLLANVMTSELVYKFFVIDLFSSIVSNHVWVNDKVFLFYLIDICLLYLWLLWLLLAVIFGLFSKSSAIH